MISMGFQTFKKKVMCVMPIATYREYQVKQEAIKINYPTFF
jgi:hypothetical protein